jgi:hypothetical protein
MALWSNTDANTSVPKFAPSLVSLENTQDNSNLLFGNTTADAFVTGETIGVFGVDTNEQQATSNNAGGHAGWVLRTEGSGGRAGRIHTETLVAMGSMSSDAEDVVYPDYTISITSQPQAANNAAAGSVTFEVSAVTVPSGGTLSYQWSVDENESGTMVELTGETAATLSLDNIATDNLYRVVVSVTGGNDVTSSNAALTIDA